MARITQRSLATSTLANLQASLSRSARLQETMSSGKQITKPSDAPGRTASAMQLRSTLKAAQQHIRNADDGISWLTTADSALQDASASLRRARTLAVAGASTGSAGAAQRSALATEISAIRDGLVATANSTYLGRPVFGGTTSDSVAFDATGTYVGDGGTVDRRIGITATVRVDVSGTAAFGTGATNAFAVLDTLVNDLLTAPGNVAADIGALDTALDNVLAALSDAGARYNRIDESRRVTQSQVITLQSQLSEVEDVDIAQLTVEIGLQDTAYQAALAATARVIQPSLLDFLR